MTRKKSILAVIATAFLLVWAMFLVVGTPQAQTSDPYAGTSTTDDGDGFNAGWLGLLGLFGLMGLRRRHEHGEVHHRAERGAHA